MAKSLNHIQLKTLQSYEKILNNKGHFRIIDMGGEHIDYQPSTLHHTNQTESRTASWANGRALKIEGPFGKIMAVLDYFLIFRPKSGTQSFPLTI